MNSTGSAHEHEQERAAAAEWLARRDRGLTPAEQDAYLQWLTERPSRAALVAECERAWARLDVLRQWRPAHSAHPNPDLLATRRPTRAAKLRGVFALAAVLALGVFLGWQAWRDDRADGAQIVPGPERLVLEDGSLVELNAGARVAVTFSARERRVRLTHGEAHFTVAKNPARPFVVEVDGYAVRAVGTAFLVQRGSGEVAVMVTEGQVRVSLAPKLASAGVGRSSPQGYVRSSVPLAARSHCASVGRAKRPPVAAPQCSVSQRQKAVAASHVTFSMG